MPASRITRRSHRGPKVPLAAIAGGGALAIVAIKKKKRTEGDSASQPTNLHGMAEGTDLHRHVADMVALDREMANAFRKQLEGDALLSVPQARLVLRQGADTFEQNATQLEAELGGASSGPSAVMKKFLASAVGVVAPLLGGSRAEPVSRTLRDDVIGLRLAAVSASMLQTVANADGQSVIASIAKDGSESFTLLSEELEAVLPEAVTMEYEQRHDQAPDPSTINDSADQVDLAFSPAQSTNP